MTLKRYIYTSFHTVLLTNSFKYSYSSLHSPKLCARIFPLLCFPAYIFFSTAPNGWMILSKRLSARTPTGQCGQTMYLAVLLALQSTPFWHCSCQSQGLTDWLTPPVFQPHLCPSWLMGHEASSLNSQHTIFLLVMWVWWHLLVDRGWRLHKLWQRELFV